MAEVGQQIRRLREAKGWNQAELAVYAGIGPSGVSQIETSKRNPSAATLQKIAEALGVEISDLFPKVEAPLWSEESTEERRPYISQLRQLEQWKMYLAGCAERWEEEARNPGRFASPEAAAGASVEANRQGTYLFRTIRDRLLPTIRDQLPDEIADEQLLELGALVGRLNEALAAVMAAAGRSALSDALLQTAEQERNAEVNYIRERLSA
jgi:transcriptional regulator with XRE-family HTH domain